ncbi:MAG: hypothetical protein DHS20C15_25680 [Planctomycetota bacterium]|nr:MAG: hypothetical protein DHS20C15_25680 [Planctomycetota bacterium]
MMIAPLADVPHALLAAADSVTGLSPVWEQVIGRLHPMLVHLPLGLFVSAGIFAVIGGRGGRLNGTVRACLCLGVLVSLAAAASGWLFAFHEEGDVEALDRHRWAGVATVALGLVVLIVGLGAAADSGRGRAFRWGSVLLALLTMYTGHEGGELVWGSGFATEPLESSDTGASSGNGPAWKAAELAGSVESSGNASAEPKAEVTRFEEASVDDEAAQVATEALAAPVDFATQVEPILAASCYECHGPKRARGRLRLDEYEFAFSGDNPSILPGNAEGSELFVRVTLPADDEDVMPEDGERLNAEQIDVLRRWINEGATWPH